MGIFSRFERKVEDTFESTANKMMNAPISPVQIAKKAEKQMRHEKMVGAGKQYAPTLYTVMVNEDDDEHLFGYYPTLAGEIETYLVSKAQEEGLVMDGQPLVRFIGDPDLRKGKFDIIAEPVASPIISQLRQEEMQRYGIAGAAQPAQAAQAAPQPTPQPEPVFNQQTYEPAGYQPEAGGADALSGLDTFVGAESSQEDFYAATPEPGLDLIAEQPMAQEQPLVDPYLQQGQIPAQQAADQFQPQAYPQDQAQQQAFDPQFQPQIQPAVQPPAQQLPQTPGVGVPQATPGVGAPQATPETIMFAAGAAGATPTPQASAVRARLINMTENRTYDLATSRILLGRDSKSTVVVDDINASRNHAEIRFEPQGVWSVTDLGSTNGTFVNGREITSQPLNNNDQITIGMTTYVFSLV